MTIDELIALAEEAREDLGGDAQVRIACQPGYPVRAALQYVTIPHSSTDPGESLRPGRHGPRPEQRRHVPLAGHSRPPGRREPLLPRVGLARLLLHLTTAESSPKNETVAITADVLHT